MLGCLTRSSSPKGGTALTIPALAQTCPASVSHCQMLPRSISLSRGTGWPKPRLSLEGRILRVSQFQASRRASEHGPGNHFDFSASRDAGLHSASAVIGRKAHMTRA
jgi:hypothetical protein